jgi:arylsulfatase A-like enzyme
VAAAAAAAALLASRSYGRTPPFPTPRPPVAAGAPAASDERKHAAGAELVDLLIDRLDQARFHAPKLDVALPTFRAAHWRSMQAPYVRATGAARRSAQFLAFTVGGREKKLDATKNLGLGSAAELRTWNAAEASFDARTCLLAPPPSDIRFPLRVLPGARLELAPAAVNLKVGSVTFEVAVWLKGGERRVLDSLRIRANELPGWRDRSVDLAQFSGQDIDLELSTSGGSPTDPPGALWGEPAVVARAAAAPPYNVLWIVIDTMRPDPLAAWHDAERDGALARAALPPLEAWLPAMPTIAPNIDALARRGAAFVDTTSAATWTRPGTLAMLGGARSSELGLDTTPWVLPQATVSRFYASDPPLLPLLLRKAGLRPQAFVNNFFLTGYARAGVDAGFSGMVDHRHEIEDTARIVHDTVAWLDRHRDERFFVFANLNSPHSPYSPPERLAKHVPRPPLGPKDPSIRSYLGEIAKDDEAVGKLVAKLDELQLSERTLVIVTSDHGETLSREHDVSVQGIGEHTGSTRYHHATAMYDETTRSPLVLSLPGRIPAGFRSATPVQTIDIVPTVLELLGLPKPDRTRGRSLLPFIDGAPADPSRPIVSEGRAARSIRVGRHRYVERDRQAQKVAIPGIGPRTVREELYDLQEDPGERRNIAATEPEVVGRMRAALADALSTSTSVDARHSNALAGSRHVVRDDSPPSRVHLRFAGGASARRVTVTAHLADPEPGGAEPRLTASVFQADPDGLRLEGRGLDLALTTTPSGLVGLDLEIRPASCALRWEIRVDDQPMTAEQLFAGPYGLVAPQLLHGLLDPEGRLAATSEGTPLIDPRTDVGVFVTRDPGGDVGLAMPASRPEAMGEVKQLLEAWGYAAPAKGQPR